MASFIAAEEGLIADIEGITADVEGEINIAEGAYADELDSLTLEETIALYIAEVALIVGIVEIVVQSSTNLKTGINNHVKCGATEFNYGADNFAFTFKVMWDCFWDKFVSFWNGQCTIYYIIDVIFGILYGLLVELPIILIRAILGINLQPVVNDIYEIVILPLNDLVLLVTGFEIIQWSDSVTKKCFRCKGVYRNQVYHYTFNQWAQINKCNMTQMGNGFVKIFETIIPSNKWTAWLNNDHHDGVSSQEGSSNWPPFY